MSKRQPAAKVEWLLREGESERGVPVGERMVIDDDHWRLVSERIDVDAGMRVFLHTADVYRPVALTPRQSVPGIWLAANVAMKGSVDVALSDGPWATIDERRSVLFRPVDRAASFSPAPGRRLKIAGYMLRDDRVARVFGGEVPEPIQSMLERGLNRSIMLPTPASVRLRHLADSLFVQRLSGPLRAIFIEGVVLQLFALQAAGYDGPPRDRVVALSPKERAAIESARDRLLSDMRNPPTLGELAAEAGMSEKTLNAGFRALFDATVFETLRDERLDHARLALESKVVPLKTIAFRVGYNHVTNFITAFTRRFGAPPRKFACEPPNGRDDAPTGSNRIVLSSRLRATGGRRGGN